jgi:dipeptidyl aminopeptidase/acylaminoacyl peptidase
MLSRLTLVFLLLAGPAISAETWRKPPKDILDVLNAPVTPQVSFSPAADYALLLTGVRHPPLEDLAQPMLRLAGLRINPAVNGPHAAPYYTGYVLKKLPEGTETAVALPPGSRAGAPQWSPDGKRFAFQRTTAAGIELWCGEAATAKARRLDVAPLNAAFGRAIQWMPDSRTLRVQLVPADRGGPPAPPAAPPGPSVQESYGKGDHVRTYEDMLRSPHDEDLFDYYAASRLALVDTASGRVTPLGKPGIFSSASPSPDGAYLLVERIHRPYSYLYPASFFPRQVEIWDRAGKLVKQVASLPLADSVPSEGVPPGPRQHAWHPVEPGTLVWVEALDGGNPKNKAPFRDRVLTWKAPFAGAPAEFVRTEHRLAGLQWIEGGGGAFVTDLDRDRRWLRVMHADGKEAPRTFSSRNLRDAYGSPGSLMTRVLPSGHAAVRRHQGSVYLAGAGASPQGDRPFLDRLDLGSLKTERLFQSGAEAHESVALLLAADASRFVTTHESPTEPLNYYLRAAGSSDARPFTRFTDPAPQLRKISKRRVTYKRADGVQLSFTLYLPPDYKEGTRLPTVVWAYPLEYSDPGTAGQITGSTQRFTTIAGASHLFFALAGYAVLDSATMPVVGDPQTVNDTYVEQIVSSAKAAIDKAVELGVTDPQRVGVGGHSYGAFMTANLMAHSRLFRAGIARSGAYNRTLTPFGFQAERRTLWEAPETYVKMSPFFHADRIKDPLLLIHGVVDDNSGTFPIQSERMYAAVRANQGHVRLVMLPAEAHGYRARETVEHVLAEMIGWFDKHVK